MTIEEVIGQRVRAARAALAMSQTELAERMSSTLGHDWRQQYVTELERGRRKVRAAELAALAHVLGLTPGAMLTPHEDAGTITTGDGSVPTSSLRGSANDPAHLDEQRLTLVEDLREAVNTARQAEHVIAQAIDGARTAQVAIEEQRRQIEQIAETVTRYGREGR